MKLSRTNAILSLPTSVETDTFGKEGYPIDQNSDGTVDLCQDAEGNPPFGILLLGAKHPGRVMVAVAAGGLAGTVRVKLAQPVTAPGTLLKLVDTAGLIAFGPDPGTGTRIIMAQALETGAAGELIEAVIFKPVTYAA